MRVSKHSRASNLHLKVGVVSLGCLSALGISAGAANAADVGVSGDEQQTALEATVDVLAPCVWRLDNVDPELTLTNQSGFDYIGDALSLSAMDTIQIFLSGDATTQNEVCGIYVDGDAGIRLSVSANNLSFVGDGIDDSMDFTMDSFNPLVVDADAEGFGCNGSWTDNGPFDIGTTNSAVEPYSILSADVVNMDTEGQSFPEFPSCELDVSYSTDVPAGQVPAGSTTYTLTGPELVVTIVNGAP